MPVNTRLTLDITLQTNPDISATNDRLIVEHYNSIGSFVAQKYVQRDALQNPIIFDFEFEPNLVNTVKVYTQSLLNGSWKSAETILSHTYVPQIFGENELDIITFNSSVFASI